MHDHKERVEEFLKTAADGLNQALDTVGRPHHALAARDPIAAHTRWDESVRPDASYYLEDAPSAQQPRAFVDTLRRRQELKAWLERSRKRAELVSAAWKTYAIQRAEKRRAAIELHLAVNEEESAFCEALSHCLDMIEWPRDTRCESEVSWSEDGIIVYFRVDLPERDDLPTDRFSVNAESFKIEKRPMLEEETVTMWRQCVLAIAAALVQVAFNLSQRVLKVSVHGFRDLPEEDNLFSPSPLLELELDRSDYVWDRKVLFEDDDLHLIMGRHWCRLVQA